MAKETTQKITSVENMTKEKMADIIKTAKRESRNSEGIAPISIVEIMQSNMSAIIRKMESQIPTQTQLYSDLYKKYLRMINDFFNMCFVSEKEFFDKLGIDKKTLESIDANWKTISDATQKQIDMVSNFSKLYVEYRMTALDSFYKTVQLMIESYAKAKSQIKLDKK